MALLFEKMIVFLIAQYTKSKQIISPNTPKTDAKFMSGHQKSQNAFEVEATLRMGDLGGPRP